MNVVEDLIAQRDAVLFGKWVQGYPGEGEACLVFRGKHDVCQQESIDILATICGGLVGGRPMTVYWNDCYGRTREEVLDVLDEAIRTAKELGV